MKEETIIKTFKNCVICNAVDGTKDDADFEKSDNNSSDESSMNSDINEMNDSTEN